VLARPDPSVVSTDGVTDPPPSATANVTGVPPTGLPEASVTFKATR